MAIREIILDGIISQLFICLDKIKSDKRSQDDKKQDDAKCHS
jgi:hypothetical protein